MKAFWPHIKKSKLRKLANSFTVFRALSGLPALIALTNKNFSLAWIIIFLGALSDYADGKLAREAGGGTKWGAQLDPLADKLLLLSPLLWLASNSVLPVWAVFIVISRELVISYWRSTKTTGAAASPGGKAKTILQFLSILLMLWPSTWGGIDIALRLHRFGWCLFWPSLILCLYSAINYLKSQTISDPN